MATTAPVTDFSQPIYMDEPAAGSNSQSSPSDSALAQHAVIDLNDPNLLAGELDTNAHLNAYDAPPPIPDGRYKVKLKQIDVKAADGTPRRYNVKNDKNGAPYAYMALEMSIVDASGKFDGVKVYDRFVSTMQARNGGIPVVRVLTSLGVKLPAKATAKNLVELFEKALASEPMLEIETTWEGGVGESDRDRFKMAGVKEPRVYGMDRFPLGEGGVRVPKMEVETGLGKVLVTAQTRVQNYFPLGSK